MWELGRLKACARVYLEARREEGHKARVRVKKKKNSECLERRHSLAYGVHQKPKRRLRKRVRRPLPWKRRRLLPKGLAARRLSGLSLCALSFLLSAGPGCATDIRAVWPEKGMPVHHPLPQRCLRCSRCSALARTRPLYTRAPTWLLHLRENSSSAFCQRELQCGLFGMTS